MSNPILSPAQVALKLQMLAEALAKRDAANAYIEKVTAELVASGESRLAQRTSYTLELNKLESSEIHLAKQKCTHDKPSDGHCCFVECPNYAGRYHV